MLADSFYPPPCTFSAFERIYFLSYDGSSLCADPISISQTHPKIIPNPTPQLIQDFIFHYKSQQEYIYLNAKQTKYIIFMRKVVTITIQCKGEKKNPHFKEEKIYAESSIPKVNFCLSLRRTQRSYQRTDFAPR